MTKIKTWKKKNYLLIVGILVLSIVAVAVARHNQVLAIFASLPAVAALLSLLVQVLREEAAHQKVVASEERQHRFLLGATSHMANVAFDRHVLFVEEYMSEFSAALLTLAKDGPDKSLLPHCYRLVAIRQKHLPWLTQSLESELDHFESTLREIGASAHYTETAPDGERWTHHHNRLYKRFAELMGWEEWEGEELNNDRASSLLVERLRHILGIEALTTLRSSLLTAAIAESNAAAAKFSESKAERPGAT